MTVSTPTVTDHVIDFASTSAQCNIFRALPRPAYSPCSRALLLLPSACIWRIETVTMGPRTARHSWKCNSSSVAVAADLRLLARGARTRRQLRAQPSPGRHGPSTSTSRPVLAMPMPSPVPVPVPVPMPTPAPRHPLPPACAVAISGFPFPSPVPAQPLSFPFSSPGPATFLSPAPPQVPA